VLREKGIDRISPFFIIKMITDMIPGKISMKYNLKGPNFSVSSACASSAHSMITAFSMVKYGYADIMVTGGVEAPITDLTLGAFCSLKALSTGYNDTPERASRPFDGKRDGFVIAEGAGTLIFEEYEHAIRRGARIYGEILGTGATADAFHDTAPAPRGEGGRRAMELALKEGCIEKEKVEYINAHGTSTKANDLNETLSVKDLFGDYAKKLAISSTKSMTGHTLGASAAIEAIASLLTMQNGIIPPTINYENPEPELDLDYVPNIAREKKVDYVLSNSFGFGGHNGVLLLGRI
jgi:3-oxoacyl-[acyl-carrier-protein] synthase II